MAAPQPSNDGGAETAAPKRENVWLNLAFNLLIPILLLSRGKEWFGDWLAPWAPDVDAAVMAIALAFPLGYFGYDFVRRRKCNLFSILGMISVALTGGIGLLELPAEWFAVKEAAIPFALGLAVLVSLKTRYPLVRSILLNPEIMDVAKIRSGLAEHGQEAAFEGLMRRCTVLLAASFFLSAALNYGLARWIVTSPSGTEAFNEEISRMMTWSWPVITVPSMALMVVALWMLFKGIREMTGMEVEDIVRHGEEGGGKGAKNAS